MGISLIPQSNDQDDQPLRSVVSLPSLAWRLGEGKTRIQTARSLLRCSFRVDEFIPYALSRLGLSRQAVSSHPQGAYCPDQRPIYSEVRPFQSKYHRAL